MKEFLHILTETYPILTNKQTIYCFLQRLLLYLHFGDHILIFCYRLTNPK
jgi:hypothetical protein